MLSFLGSISLLGQTCPTPSSPHVCSTTGDASFFSACNGGTTGSSLTYAGDYTMTVKANTTLQINGNVTINGTLTIDVSSGNGTQLEILSPYTLKATNVIFIGNGNSKQLLVDGPSGKFLVTNNLCGGGYQITLGSGTSSAGTITVQGSITGAGNFSCGTPCPTTTVGVTCDGGTDPSSSWCKSINVVMPIILSSFNAIANEQSVDITWSTASEINFDYFNLEKSSNGKDFYSMANIKGHGTTNEQHVYFYEDNFPLIGKNYYRLTSVDFDNYQETFKIIVQNYSGEKDFQISPNPSDGKTINLHFNFDSSDGQVVIYDNMGSIVESFEIDETDKVSFANSLKDGIYLAKYSSPTFSKAIRFLVSQ